MAERIKTKKRVAFARIAKAALAQARDLVPTVLANGQRRGDEWFALNPKRNDHRLGSFAVNLRTGEWGDFAIGESGGDLISLLAYLGDRTQKEAALFLADLLGVAPYEGGGHVR